LGYFGQPVTAKVAELLGPELHVVWAIRETPTQQRQD
jgi:hypothetical protein